MHKTKFAPSIWHSSLMILAVSAASAQEYPSKVIRVISGSPGGGGDIAARIVAQGLSTTLGQQVVVDPKGGSGGLVAGGMLAKAPADGYTLLIYSNAIWLGPLMRHEQSYDVFRDFAPITQLASSPNILVVHPSLPAKSVKELIALARAKPGVLNYGTAGNGSSVHIAAELFKSMARVDIVRVNYKGGLMAAITDVIAGNVHLTFGSTGAVIPLVKTGRIRALAVTSAEPSALAPGLPTVAASGLPGYETVASHGMFAPALTPPSIVKRLNAEAVRILNQPDVKQKLLSAGVEVIANSPDQFSIALKSEIAKIDKVIKDAGIRSD